MTTLQAIGNIGGAMLGLFALGAIIVFIGEWEAGRNRKRLIEDVAMKLGVSVQEIDNDALLPRILEISTQRFDSELLRNRLSDFCGTLRTVWLWSSALLQVVILGAATWYAFTERLDNALYAWFALGVAAFFWVMSVIFSLICKLLTGRYPGEAKFARQQLAAFLRTRRGAELRQSTDLASTP